MQTYNGNVSGSCTFCANTCTLCKWQFYCLLSYGMNLYFLRNNLCFLCNYIKLQVLMEFDILGSKQFVNYLLLITDMSIRMVPR
jgi:hypothetical protein